MNAQFVALEHIDKEKAQFFKERGRYRGERSIIFHNEGLKKRLGTLGNRQIQKNL